MKFSLIHFTTMALLATTTILTDAFAPSSLIQRSFVSPRYTKNEIKIHMSSDDITVDTSPMEPGSHDELMYALGVNLARQLGDVRPLVDNGDELASVAKGLLDTVIGRLSEDGQRILMAQRGQDLNDLISERANNLRARLEDDGRQMLREMSEREETETLESGVVLHVTQYGPYGPGMGAQPTESSVIKVHYHGTLADGTVFDSTLDGEPAVFPLANVIPGWCEGIMHMREGETAMLGIPPELAYGMEGTPDGRVPGGSTLFFKVDLMEVLSPDLVGVGETFEEGY